MDSELPASELNRRYPPGGTLPDDQLSASQNRARAGIKPNTWSKTDASKGSASSSMQGLVILTVGVAVVAVVVYVLSGAKGF